MDGKLMITGEDECKRMSNTNLGGQHFQKDASKQDYKNENNAGAFWFFWFFTNANKKRMRKPQPLKRAFCKDRLYQNMFHLAKFADMLS